MKNAITGGMSEQDARAMLLKRGIVAFQAIAGSLPQKNSEIAKFDDLPPFWFDSAYHDCFARLENASHDYIGALHGINIRFDVMICWECAHALRDYFNLLSPTIRLFAHTHEGYCGLCGKWEHDDIPF